MDPATEPKKSKTKSSGLSTIKTQDGIHTHIHRHIFYYYYFFVVVVFSVSLVVAVVVVGFKLRE